MPQDPVQEGVDPALLHGEMPPEGMPPEGMPPEGMPPEAAPPEAAPPEGMPPEGMPPEAAPPEAAPPEGPPQEPEIDPSAQKFYQDKMLGHLDGVRSEMEDDPKFADGLAKSKIGSEILSEVAHWDKKRVMDLLKDMVENPDVAHRIHDAYQESVFHGRHEVEQWREERYHNKGDGKDDEDEDASSAIPMDEESEPNMPIDSETTPNMDEEAGGSGTVDAISDMAMKKSKKPKLG